MPLSSCPHTFGQCIKRFGFEFGKAERAVLVNPRVLNEGGKERVAQEDLYKDIPNKNGMGYYCKLCQCFHNTNSEIGRAHRRYASQRPPARTRKDFWDKFW